MGCLMSILGNILVIFVILIFKQESYNHFPLQSKDNKDFSELAVQKRVMNPSIICTEIY